MSLSTTMITALEQMASMESNGNIVRRCSLNTFNALCRRGMIEVIYRDWHGNIIDWERACGLGNAGAKVVESCRLTDLGREHC